jgi:hypothetical protein
MVNHFNTTLGISVGIGIMQGREGLVGSLVVDAMLVTKLSHNNFFHNDGLEFMKDLDFFGNTVRILPSAEWSLCSSIQSSGDCVRFKSFGPESTIECGWCDLLQNCMQGKHIVNCLTESNRNSMI